MAHSSLIAFSWISSTAWKRRPFKGFNFGKQESLLGLSPENRVDGAQQMSDVLPDNCGWGATSKPVHCRGATSKPGLPTIRASSCAQRPSNSLKLPGTTVCLSVCLFMEKFDLNLYQWMNLNSCRSVYRVEVIFWQKI